jgi:hypothetical protein
VKIWKDHPKELRVWRRRAMAKRRAMIKACPDKSWDDYELPYIPNEYTVSLNYAEWRLIHAGAHV